MTGMDMGAFSDAYKRSQENSGMTFGDIDKLLVRNNLTVRLIGSMASVHEHFVNTPKGVRPVYCVGPGVVDESTGRPACKLCGLIAGWAMSEDPDTQEAAKDQKAKEKFYFNVLDRSAEGAKWHAENKRSMLLVQNEKGNNIGPQLLQAFGAICQMRKEQGKSEDPNTFDMMIQKSGVKFNTKYSALPTGDENPLTEEELAYELYDLSQLTQLTSQADVDVIFAYLSGELQSTPAPAQGFNTQAVQTPAQSVGAAMGGTPPAQPAQPMAAPAAAVPPAAAPAAAAPAPAAAPAAAAPAPAATAYANTTPTQDFNPKTHYQVPCGDCGKMMQISLTDTTDMQCHGCGKVYGHPSKVEDDTPF